jgi:hypothetical protein
LASEAQGWYVKTERVDEKDLRKEDTLYEVRNKMLYMYY